MIRRVAPTIILVGLLAVAVAFLPGQRFGTPVPTSSISPAVAVKLASTNLPLRIFPGVAGVMIRLQDGSLWQWGGDGPLGRKKVPQQIGTNLNWVEAFIANNHCVGRQSDGSLWEWGYCGDGKMRPLPWRVGADSDWIGVAAGDVHSLALKSNGTIWGWGDNSSQQLSPLLAMTVPAPMQIGSATNWQAVACGQGSHSAALAADGALWAWGSIGFFANATTPTILTQPTKVCSDSDWTDLRSGPILCAVAGNSLWHVFNSPPTPDAKRTNVCSVLRTNFLENHVAFAFCGRPELFEIRADKKLYRSIYNPSPAGGQHSDWRNVGDGNEWISIAGHGTAIGLNTHGTLWTWGQDPGLDPIPDAKSKLKIFTAAIARRFGRGPASLQTMAIAPYQSDPRPLLKLEIPQPR